MIERFDLPKRMGKGCGVDAAKGQTEHFVGIQSAEFFGEAVPQGAARQGDPLRGLSRLGQFSH